MNKATRNAIGLLRRNIFNLTGLYLSKSPKYKGKAEFSIDNMHYGNSFPSANYAPWSGDTAFMEVYSSIKDFTLVDIYRCFELWQLVDNMSAINQDASIIEIGVWRGGTAAVMAKKLSLTRSASMLYLADTFTGVAKASEKDEFYSGGEHEDTSQDLVENLLNDKIKFSNYKILKGIFPDETSHLIPEGELFGLCHIDVDVYDSAKGVVDWIWDKMLIGGIIIFDDYGFHTCSGVTRYVNELRNNSDRIIIHNLNGHALMIKIK